MYNENKQLIGFQGRSLRQSSTKYITVMLDDNSPKVYGLDSVNKNDSIFIVEGVFDSIFVKNSIAMCGADLDINLFNWNDYVWIFDNEPRNREIVNRIHKCIDKGQKVVIWPNSIKQKDINDMVLDEHEVMSVIKSNIYSGLQAKIKFNNWKKI